MKKAFLLIFIGLFFAGCAATGSQSEVWQHDTMYKNWDHTMFSIYGYRHPTAETLKQSQEQGWWGIEIPYIPAE
jgi:hypothetical protein